MKFIPKSNIKFKNDIISKLSEKFNLDENIIKLLHIRGINSEEKIAKYLNPEISDFNNPFLLHNMKQVIKKIQHYAKSNSKIVILGDYDTDGICASAIMYKYLSTLTKNVEVFLPNRVADGYGLTKDTIDKIDDLYHPNFIITVDCGISAKDEVEYCLKKGIDIVITDHHDIPEQVPNCLIINPKMPNQKYKFKELCGAGVALKIIQAILGVEASLNQYVTLASIATVADIVPLTNENRCIVYYGLKNQEENLPKGIIKLLKILKCDLPLKSTDISFKLAPKLNATGRMGDATVSFNLFIEKDDKKIDEINENLIQLNDKRLNETNKIIDDVVVKLENVNISKIGVIVLYNPKWESGVLGIICSKLVEKFNRPTCILTKVDNEYKGSLRSVPGINIFEALSNVKEHLIQFGGHNQAAGITIEPQKLEIFKYALNDYVLKKYTKKLFVQEKQYDLDISKFNITEEFVKQLDVLEPCGLQNEKPQFKLSFNNASVSHMTNHFNHLCVKLNNLNLVGFNMGEYVQILNTNANKEMIVEIQLENFRNKRILKGLIKYINCGKLNTPLKNEITFANYISQLKHIDCSPKQRSKSNLKYLDEDYFYKKISDKISQSEFGTIVVANNFDSYLSAVNKLPKICNFELQTIKDSSGVNSIIFMPDENTNFKNYLNIFFLDKPICDGYIYNILSNKNRVFIQNCEFRKEILNNLETDRKVFAIYHNCIKELIDKNIKCGDIYNYFDNIKKLNPQNKKLNFYQFKFVCLVLEELKIIEINNESFSISINKTKNELSNSKIYNYIKSLGE